MEQDLLATAVVGSNREFRNEAELRSLMAEIERLGGTQTSFCKARGVSLKTFQGWRRRLGLTAGATAGKPADLAEIEAASGPSWDVELSLGDGVVLRLRGS